MPDMNDNSDRPASGAAGGCVQTRERFVPRGSVVRIGEDRGHETVYYDSDIAPGICYVWLDLLDDWEQEQIRREANAA